MAEEETPSSLLLSGDLPPTVLELHRPEASVAGRELCLQAGDVLVAVNGQDFDGNRETLREMFRESKGRQLALTFLRGELQFTVLSATPVLGTWIDIDALPGLDDMRPLDPDVMSNWEVFRSRDGVYDVNIMRGSLLALFFPPLWLLQSRLWALFGAVVAAAMVAAAVSQFMLIAVYLTSGLHFWHMGTKYVRKDRMARGMHAYIVLASPSERALHAAYAKIHPEDQFLFGPTAEEMAGGVRRSA